MDGVKYELFSTTLEHIVKDEKCKVMEKTRDKWLYRNKCKDVDSRGYTNSFIILQLYERGDGSNEPVGLLFEHNFYSVHVGKEYKFQTDHPCSCQLSYFRRTRETVTKARKGSIQYDIQAFARSYDKITLLANDGKAFSMSKLLFMARSKVFREMFEKDTKENRENCVHFKNMDSNALEKLVMFIQTDKVDQLDTNTAYQLGLASLEYDLPLLLKPGEEYFFIHRSVENAQLILELAYKHKSRKLALAFALPTE